MAKFITLTYPSEYPSESKSKEHLREFHRRMVSVFGEKVTSVWRLELQQRGAPHYHLITWGVTYLPHEWVARAWFDVVGSGDEKHLKAGTQVEAVRSENGVIWYAAKYLSKVTDKATTGRAWGILNRKYLVLHEERTLEITPAEFSQVGDNFDKTVKKRVYSYMGFTLYGRERVASFLAKVDKNSK